MPVKKAPLTASPSKSQLEGNGEVNSNALENKKDFSVTSVKNAERKTGPKTRITVQFDVGYANSLYIRGKGASLSWDRGQPLVNVNANEWIWETSLPFTTCEFKVLINDTDYEIGDNHLISCGASLHFTPKFH
jgi:hypothetical protein